MQYEWPNSRHLKVSRQGQAVWGWKSPAEFRGRVFGGLHGGAKPSEGGGV